MEPLLELVLGHAVCERSVPDPGSDLVYLVTEDLLVELIDHEFEYLVAGADGAGHGAGVDAGIPANRTQCSQDKGLEKSNNSTEADKD